MRPYLLLTPGPLTTSESVKTAMMTDWCTWDEDYNVHIVEEIRKGLVQLATRKTDEYTSILMQGSGTYCVEATLGSVITPKHKLLILSNGAYGERMGNIAEYHGMNYDMLAFDETEQVSVEYVDDYLAHNAEITHVAVVHCETTTGILNPLKEIAHMVKMHGKKLIVDAMSSFGGVPLDVEELGIDFMISSANKCIQGVPGFYDKRQRLHPIFCQTGLFFETALHQTFPCRFALHRFFQRVGCILQSMGSLVINSDTQLFYTQ